MVKRRFETHRNGWSPLARAQQPCRAECGRGGQDDGQRDDPGPSQFGGRRQAHAAPVIESLSDSLQLDTRLSDVAQPLLHVAVETPPEQTPESWRRCRGQHRPINILPQDRREHVRGLLTSEGAPPSEHLEQHDAECPDIGPLVDGLAARLFRRHIRRSSEDHAGGGHRRGARDCRRVGQRGAGRRGGVRVEGFGEAEVEHFHRAVRSHLDVRGLQIAVNDPLLVSGFERLGDLFRDRHRLVERNRAECDAL